MKELLIVETRDAAEHRGPGRMVQLAAGMSRRGITATILLAENGAFSARRCGAGGLQAAMGDGVAVAVDRFALEERGIPPEDLCEGIAAVDVDLIVERLAAGASVIWR